MIIGHGRDGRAPPTRAVEPVESTPQPPSVQLPMDGERLVGDLAPAPAAPQANPTSASTPEATESPVLITGRVLLPDGRTPAGAARVTALIRPIDGAGPRPLKTDVAGTFAFPIDRGRRIDHVEFFFVAADRSAWLQDKHFVLDSIHGTDLGDIVLDPLEVLRLQVVDESGQPVAGATASAIGHDDLSSWETDANGLVSLEPLPKDSLEVEVGALGFACTRAEIPRPLPLAPLRLALTRCPRLTVRAELPEGARDAGLCVLVESAEAPFASLRPGKAAGKAYPSPHSGTTYGLVLPPRVEGALQARTRCMFWLDHGRVELSDLKPGLPMDISLVDPTCTRAWGPTSVTLAPAEHRELNAPLTELPGPLTVRVVDPEGVPVSRAWVGVFGLDTDLGDQTQVDRSGLASFPYVVGPRVGISVESAPWERVFLRDVEVQRDGPVEVRLRGGTRLVVHITDEAGAPLDVDEILICLHGHVFRRLMTAPDPKAQSRFEFEDLPREPIELVILQGEREVRHTVDATSSEVTVSVPR